MAKWYKKTILIQCPFPYNIINRFSISPSFGLSTFYGFTSGDKNYPGYLRSVLIANL